MNKISFSRANDLLRKGALLADVRDPVAYRDGHIDGAVNLPLRNFVNAIMGIQDKNKSVIIYSDTLDDVSLKQSHVYAVNLGFGNVYVATYTTLKEETQYTPPVPVKKIFQKSSKIKKKGP